MALVAACTNTRSRNPKRKLSGNNINNESNKLPLISNSINLQMAIPALNSQNGIISRKGAVGSLNGLTSEKTESNNISAQGNSSKKESKKTVKTVVPVPFRPFRKSVRLLIRKRGTTNLSGKSTCSDIPEPVTLPRTVEYFSDVHKLHDDPQQSDEGFKLLFLAGLGMYRNLDALGLEYRRQVLQEECDKFESTRPPLDSSLDFSNNSYYEDVDDYEITTSPLPPPPRTPSPLPPPSNLENSVCQTTEIETEGEAAPPEDKSEEVNWDVNMTVLITRVGNKHVEDEVVVKSDKSEMPSSTDLNEDKCTIASTQPAIKASNVNIVSEKEKEDWINFDPYMKDQLAQERVKCPPKKVNKREIEDAKRKLIQLREQWGI